ncbi:MAG: hypothetical protein ACLS63_06085 [Flavonifractor plautii]
MIDEFDRVLTTRGTMPTCVLPRAATTAAPTASFRPSGAATAAAAWRTCWPRPEAVGRRRRECIVIAQDITRYGIDLYGERKLAALLRELCKMDFRWMPAYLYPDEFTDELMRHHRRRGQGASLIWTSPSSTATTRC